MSCDDQMSFRQAAIGWQSDDPDELSVRAMGELIEAGDESKLIACFEPPMEFGTAGLRGVVGPGPAQMNVAVVRRVTRALTDVVRARASGNANAQIVLGFDGRLDSRRFAEEAVGVIAASGLKVAYFAEPVPTPVVAFAGLRMGAQASVVITASHNPPEYNGYKVYGAEGIQIVPPFDSEVAERLAVVGPAKEIPCDERAFSGEAPSATRLGASMLDAYTDAVLSARVATATAATLRIAYSPLHGVGWRVFERVFAGAGYRDLHVEPSQRDIDGHFPTVRFPNPEEPATLERGLGLAQRIGADLLIVNDPDADRLGAALPDRSGNFRILSGNEIGLILTDYLLSHATQANQSLVVSTLVSSPMVEVVARAHGAHAERTLTGFKWLWSAVRALEAEGGSRFALCWEEALGFSTHRAVRDKDGIAAGLTFADWASECRRAGVLPLDRLGELYRRYGAWGSAPMNLVRPGAEGAAEIGAMLQRLAEHPPRVLLDRPVLSVTDYSKAVSERPLYRGAAAMFVIEMAGDARIIVRPSGTEPKLKLYSDVKTAVLPGEDPFVAYERAKALAGRLGEALVHVLA